MSIYGKGADGTLKIGGFYGKCKPHFHKVAQMKVESVALGLEGVGG